jgi:hypothetical protein
MHLVDNPRRHTLHEASALTGVPVAVLRRDTAATIRGGAAVPRARADAVGLTAGDRAAPAAWFEAMARHGGADAPRTARLHADGVHDLLVQGVTARAEDGSAVAVRPDAVQRRRPAPSPTATASSKDRAHVVGHAEVPGNDHTDPGPYGDRNRYMEPVGGSAGGDVQLGFPSYATLRSGSAGNQVSAARWLLNARGFDAGAVDGRFGPGTAAVVRSFQTARQPAADGVAAAATWGALRAGR